MKMKKIIAGAAFAATLVMSQAAVAGINVNIGVSLPPLVTFQTPPSVVVVPDLPDVYVVPSVDADIFFSDGWWWRTWNGKWFRSHDYNNGWASYDHEPLFYGKMNKHWRQNYNNNQWQGRQWDHEEIPYNSLQKNWKTWKQEKHWKNQQWNNNGNGQAQQGNNYQQLNNERQYKNYKHDNHKWKNHENDSQQQDGYQNGNGQGNNPMKGLFK